MNQTDITLIRLANQQLTRTSITDPVDMVSWFGAVQAQEFAGSKWSLGLRLRPTFDSVIEQAFNDGRILRTHVMRPTWHYVTPTDIRWLLNLTGPRVQQVNGSTYRQVGLDSDTLTRAADIMVKALQSGQQLTRPELGEAIEVHGITPAKGLRLTSMAMWAELEALICSGPRRGKQFTYMLLDERAPNAITLDRPDARAELLRRYFQSHGPATDRDFARWSGLTLTDTRQGLEDLRSELHQEEFNGKTYWFVPSPEPPPFPPEPTAYLVSIFDEYAIGYKEFGSVADEDMGKELWDLGNLLQNVLIIDGRIRGTWRWKNDAKTVTIDLNPLTPMSAADRQAIARAAEELGAYLERTAEVLWPET